MIKKFDKWVVKEEQALKAILKDEKVDEDWIDYHLGKSQGLHVEFQEDNGYTGQCVVIERGEGTDEYVEIDWNFIGILIEKYRIELEHASTVWVVTIGNGRSKYTSLSESLIEAVKRCVIKKECSSVV